MEKKYDIMDQREARLGGIPLACVALQKTNTFLHIFKLLILLLRKFLKAHRDLN
jgi:hypothetical protein